MSHKVSEDNILSDIIIFFCILCILLGDRKQTGYCCDQQESKPFD